MDARMNHFDQDGNAVMVDVSEKAVTARVAVARGRIVVGDEVLKAVAGHDVRKGDVLGVARVAGIMAVKNTANLIPMCHPLNICQCALDFETLPEAGAIDAICTVKIEGKTGVEMEALVGVNIALLTIYDMCKALSRSIFISDVRLVYKEGGKSGVFGVRRDDA